MPQCPASQDHNDDGRLRLLIQTLTGCCFALDVHEQDTVWAVKLAVLLERRIPPYQQRMLFAGREMRDAQTLAECGVRDGATVHLVLRCV